MRLAKVNMPGFNPVMVLVSQVTACCCADLCDRQKQSKTLSKVFHCQKRNSRPRGDQMYESVISGWFESGSKWVLNTIEVLFVKNIASRSYKLRMMRS